MCIKLGKSHEQVSIIQAALLGGDYLNLNSILRYTVSVGKTWPTSSGRAGITVLALFGELTTMSKHDHPGWAGLGAACSGRWSCLWQRVGCDDF